MEQCCYYDKRSRKLYNSIEEYENRTGDIEHEEVYTDNILIFEKSRLGELMANRIIQPKYEFRIIY